MRYDILLYVLGALFIAGAITSTIFAFQAPHTLEAKNTKIPKKISQLYAEWKQQYGVPQFDQDTENFKLSVFYENYKWIQKNNKTADLHLGLNQFADITPAEFKATYLGLSDSQQSCNNTATPPATNLTSVDWRTSNSTLTPVKNQGQCGSCWAFSTVESLESEAAVHGSGSQKFSPQQLVDCSKDYGNMGCNGGLMDLAFKYVMDKGITTEDKYPYQGRDQDCKVDGGDFKIKRCFDIPANDCDTLKNSIAQQPVSVAVDAVTWQFYIGGTFPSFLCGKSLDHGVQAVGFNEKGQWIVRNSWGAMWGQHGFITLAKGNTCGICKAASYPSIN